MAADEREPRKEPSELPPPDEPREPAVGPSDEARVDAPNQPPAIERHEPAVEPAAAEPSTSVPPPRPPARAPWFAEPPERAIETPRAQLESRSRRDFLLFWAGIAASVAGAW